MFETQVLKEWIAMDKTDLLCSPIKFWSWSLLLVSSLSFKYMFTKSCLLYTKKRLSSAFLFVVCFYNKACVGGFTFMKWLKVWSLQQFTILIAPGNWRNVKLLL